MSAAGASWSPDGTQIAFAAGGDDLDARTRILAIDATGGAPREVAALAAPAARRPGPRRQPDRLSRQRRGGRAARLARVALGRRLRRWHGTRSRRTCTCTSGRPTAPTCSTGGATGQRARVGRQAAVTCPVTVEGRSTLGRFPLDGAPALVEGADAPLLRATAGHGAIVLVAPSGGAAEIEVVGDGRRRGLTRNGSAWADPYARLVHNEVDVPGRAGPSAPWCCLPRRPTAPADGALDRGRPRWRIEPGAVAAGHRARARRLPRAASRPARVGLARTRLARRDGRGVGRGRCRGSARGLRLGGGPGSGRTGRWSAARLGGFMTSWLMGRSDRFRAAVSVNGVSNQVAAVANCGPRGRLDAAARLGLPAGRRRPPVGAVAARARGPDPDAAAPAAGRGRPALPRGGQRAALHRAARARPRGGVHAVARGVAPDAVDRRPGSARGHARADARVARSPRCLP